MLQTNTVLIEIEVLFMNIGSIIKYYRTKKGLTQTDLAEGICSISHLSKIETNMYTANEETVNLLLSKLGLKLQDITGDLREIRDTLEAFMHAICMHDRESIEQLYQELLEKEDYILTSEYVNLYHLYKLRYCLFHWDHQGVQESLKMIQKIKNTFDPVEKNILLFFRGFYHSMNEKYEEGLKAVHEFLNNPLPIGGMWVAEASYILSHLYTSINDNEAALTFSKKAYDVYVAESNFTRQVHSQMILGISYMRLSLYSEALTVYKSLLRNTRMFFKATLYPGVLINYARCLYLVKDYTKAKKAADEAIELSEPFSYAYGTSLLIWLESKVKLNDIDKSWHSRMRLLKETDAIIGNKYFYHHSNFLEKYEFSQPAGIKYAVKYLYPHLLKLQSFSDALEVLEMIIDYYESIGDVEKVNHYYSQWRKLISKERRSNE
ncbi:helix-turn-helix transcriptional regulator [Jeotgalibacillus haloalkalitolerans]|uniref:Helix-turn-helix transcriptional regulator n=1 Tax=Jeotgalibacillus haloalkalitolerans TaxID=3104292 RepID=A0ABU5KJ55_9BACL|nr:helix-turn-helix transcriptional regulator [Jeotgalibacillus sp. HH7-29]MDZ5711290.1 helix-turn-helix transcriptional regulator [Jeotgalibacillus sp. HH7-29]